MTPKFDNIKHKNSSLLELVKIRLAEIEDAKKRERERALSYGHQMDLFMEDEKAKGR